MDLAKVFELLAAGISGGLITQLASLWLTRKARRGQQWRDEASAYETMAKTISTQATQIDTLMHEVAELRKQVDDLKRYRCQAAPECPGVQPAPEV